MNSAAGEGAKAKHTGAIVVPRESGLSRLWSLWPWVAAVLSGVLLAFCYAPWDKGGLVWFALTPLVTAVWASKGRRNFALGYVAGVVFFTITFHWLHALGELFHTPALRGLPLLLALYLALYPAVWCWFLGRVLVPGEEDRRFPNSLRNLATGVLAASAWTGLEWTRGWFLSGFGWNGLGVALHKDLPMIQVADLVGVLGLTWLVAFTNVMAVIIVRRIIGELGPVFLKRIRWEFSLSMAVIMFTYGYGLRALWKKPAPTASKALVAVIQPNIPQEDKFDRDAEDRVLEQIELLTKLSAVLHPDLMIWPESAVPRGVYADQHNFEFINKIRADISCPLLLGSLVDDAEGTDVRTYNGAVLLPPGKEELKDRPPEYRKMHLVPFGEYLPLRPLLGWIAGSLVPGDIDAGKDATLFSHPKLGHFATLICFEDTLGGVTRRFFNSQRETPSVLVNITNDGWFLKTCAMDQHLANATFRAIESRRPLIRCANTGVTGIVLPTGHVERWVEPFRQHFAVRQIDLRETPVTFYSRYGDWLAWISAGATLVLVVRYFVRRRAA